MIRVSCDSCERKLKLKDAAAGRQIRCPDCGHPVKVPELESAYDDYDDDGYGDEWETERPARPRRPSPKRRAAKKKRGGGRGVQFNVVAAVIGGLAFLCCCLPPCLLPAVQQARDAARRAEFKNVPAPAVEDRFALQPVFETTDGEYSAGTAFAVTLPVRNTPVILTAIHLFGTSGALQREIPTAQLGQFVQRVHLMNAFADERLGTATRNILISDAAPMGEPSAAGDIAAFAGDPGLNVTALSLAQRVPASGYPVWVVADVQNRPGQPLHRAWVRSNSGGELEYAFDEQLELRATSGAPVLDQNGDVVGIQLGGYESGMITVGIANPVDVFRQYLR